MSSNCAVSRRQFLISLCAPAIAAKFPAKSESPLPGICKPEFWFGDRVSFCWNDEDTEQPYSETGEVIGVAWNPRENYWEYSVTWLSSTVYPSSNYPLFDANFLTAEELCKL